jgi:hypothetical protein
MNTAAIIIGTALAVGFSFTAWLFHVEYMNTYPTLFGDLLLFLFGMISALGISTVIVGRDIGN